VHGARGHAQEVAGSALDHLGPAGPGLDPHPSADDVQRGLVLAVVVPPRDRPRLGVDDAGPHPALVHREAAGHPRRGIGRRQLVATDAYDGDGGLGRGRVLHLVILLRLATVGAHVYVGAMASKLNPYLQFRDNARDAITFYQGVFGGDLNVSTFGDFGSGDDVHGAAADGVMHAQLDAPHGFTLMASDVPPGMDTGGALNNGTISLSGDDDADLRGYFDKLADGGQVTMPLEKQMWGDEFGMLTDKFGIPWMVNIAAVQAGDAQG
jgi:PhnB protein